jgi:hypothetical protein
MDAASPSLSKARMYCQPTHGETSSGRRNHTARDDIDHGVHTGDLEC